MVLLLPPIPSPVAINMTFKELGEYSIMDEKKVTILELSSFLYDFSLLYDCIALSAIPLYDNYKFSRYFWYRTGRPLSPDHRLYLNKINHNSPLGLEVIIPLTAAVLGMPWIILQAIEKIQNWPLNREKLKLEVEKLRKEVQQTNEESFIQDIELDNVLKTREAINTFNQLISRLEERQFVATDLEIKTLKEMKNNIDKKQ